jgi:hypothetical protein
MSDPLPPKKEIALALLERSSVHVHLDPRAPGTLVPAWFKKQPQLVLQVGLNMPVPIPDLRVDESGFSCTLSFNRTPFFCVVPWVSVYALVGDDGRGMVWPEDVPPEVASQAKKSEADAPEERPRPQKVGPRRIGPQPLEGRPSAESRDQDAKPNATTKEAASDGESAASKAKKPKKRLRPDAAPAPLREAREARERDSAEGTPPTRANLVAVPSAPPSKPAAAPAVAKKPTALPQKVQRISPPDGQGHGQGQAPTASPAQNPPRAEPPAGVIQAERRPNAAPRPKRELPPYLRVVK